MPTKLILLSIQQPLYQSRGASEKKWKIGVLCHGPNHRDVDEDEEIETEVDEEAFVESLIDREGYEAEFVVVIERNDIMRIASHHRLNMDNFLEADGMENMVCNLPPMNVNAGTPPCTQNNEDDDANLLVCQNDIGSLRTPISNVFPIVNNDCIVVEQETCDNNTIVQLAIDQGSDLRATIVIETFQGRTKTTPIDLTKSTPKKFLAKGKERCAKFLHSKTLNSPFKLPSHSFQF